MSEYSDFETHLRNVFLELDNIYTHKASEYAGAYSDPFINIKRVAEAVGETPEKTCFILATKHWQSLLHNWETYNDDTRREKINDIHLYVEYAYKIGEEK